MVQIKMESGSVPTKLVRLNSSSSKHDSSPRIDSRASTSASSGHMEPMPIPMSVPRPRTYTDNAASQGVKKEVTQVDEKSLKMSSKRKGRRPFSIMLNTNPEKYNAKINRINTKEQDANIGLAFLRSLQSEFRYNQEGFPEFIKWLDDIETIIEKKTRPLINIGLYGATGVGKSSMLNALLDCNILHCNPMRAGTSVVTIVSYNYDNDPEKLCRAEVETLTREDWIAELDILFRDIRDLPEGAASNIFGGSDAGIALAKLKAVYPDIDPDQMAQLSPENLLCKRSTRGIFGITRVFEEKSPAKLRNSLYKFINGGSVLSDDSYRRPAFWPLVRLIRIYIKVDWLKSGIQLVDLPGVADSNAARSRVAEGFLKDLHAVWIVAPINRAVDDKTAEDLLDRSFKRQARLDGILNEHKLTFVMTRCDDINVSEMVDILDLKGVPDVSKLTANLGKLEKNLPTKQRQLGKAEKGLAEKAKTLSKTENIIQELKGGKKSTGRGRKSSKVESSGTVDIAPSTISTSAKKGKKRKASDIDSDDENPNLDAADKAELKQLKSKRLDLLEVIRHFEAQVKDKKQVFEEACDSIDEAKSTLREICIKKRNEWSAQEIRSKFAQEIRDLENDIAEGSGQKPTIYYSKSIDSLPVFCVSSKAFNQLRGRNRTENPIQGIENLDDTNSPRLREHCIETSVSARERIADDFHEELALLNKKFLRYAEDRNADICISSDERNMMEQVLKRLQSKMIEVLNHSPKQKVALLKEFAEKDIASGLNSAIRRGEKSLKDIVEGWFNNKGKNHIHWATLKAACRRNGGPYTTSKKVKYNLNDAVTEKFWTVITDAWDRCMNQAIPAEAPSYADVVNEALDGFCRDLVTEVTKIKPEIAGQLTLMLTQRSHLEFIVKRDVHSAFDIFVQDGKVINRHPLAKATQAMAPVYGKVSDESGPGSSTRIREHITEHVDDIRPSLYRDTGRELWDSLLEALKRLSTTLQGVAQAPHAKIRRDFINILDRGGEDMASQAPRAQKIKVKDRIIRHMQDLDKAWTGTSLEGLIFANYQDSEVHRDNEAIEAKLARDEDSEDGEEAIDDYDSVDDEFENGSRHRAVKNREDADNSESDDGESSSSLDEEDGSDDEFRVEAENNADHDEIIGKKPRLSS